MIRQTHHLSTETRRAPVPIIEVYIQNAKLHNYKNVPDPQWMFAISMFSKTEHCKTHI